MLMQVLLFVLSISALYVGAEFSLSSAEKIGRYFGLSALTVGLLIIGFGTSLPEFFVSQLASYRGVTGMALGNIVGSNIANTLLILGVSGLLIPLNMANKEIGKQFKLHLILTVLLVVGLVQKELTLLTGASFLAFFIFYLTITFKDMKNEKQEVESEDQEEAESIDSLTFLKLFAGFALLYVGGELLVSSGSEIGKYFGISEYVISAIFVAFGTSFPELVTAILACTKKKDTDLITGNIIGSNIFNVAFVLGSLTPYQIKIEADYRPELFLLLFLALVLIGLNMFKQKLSKVVGGIFLMLYLGTCYYWIAS